jgi:hypothetical protein
MSKDDSTSIDISSTTIDDSEINDEDDIITQQQSVMILGEELWSHIIIPFILPHDYTNLCLTSRVMKWCLEQNESYRWCYFMNGPDYYPPYMFPSASFLNSSVPFELNKLMKTKRRNDLLYDFFYVKKEDCLRPLLKLVNFNFSYVSRIDWFKEDAKDIQFLIDCFQTIDSEDNTIKEDINLVGELIVKYGPYLQNINEFTVELNRLYLEEPGLAQLSHKAIKTLIEIDPNILTILRTPDRLINDKELVVTAVKAVPEVRDHFLTDTMLKERDIALEVVKVNSEYFHMLSPEFKSDKEIILTAMKPDSTIYPIIPKKLKQDDDILLAALNAGVCELKDMPKHMRANRDIVTSVIQKDGIQLKYASTELQNSRQLVLKAVSNSDYLEDASEKFRDNIKIVTKSVENNGCTLKYASKRFKDNEEIVKLAVKSNPDAFQFASNRLRNNYEFAKLVGELNYCSARLKNNKKFVIAIVRINGIQYNYCSNELKNDEDVVMCAVTIDGNMLQYVPKKFKSNFDIVIRAMIVSNGKCLAYASDELKRDSRFILYYMKQTGTYWNETPQKLLSNREFVLSAVQYYGDILRFVTEELRLDKEILSAAPDYSEYILSYFGHYPYDKKLFLAAVSKNYRVLEYASNKLLSDKDILLAALDDLFCDDHKIHEIISKTKLIKDKEFLLKIIKKRPTFYCELSEKLQRNMDIVLTAVRYQLDLHNLPDELQKNRRVVMEAVKHDGYKLELIPPEYSRRRDIILEALKQNGGAVLYLPKELKCDYEIAKTAITSNCYHAFQYFPVEFLLEHRDLIIDSMKQRGITIQCLPPDIRCDREIALHAIQQDGISIGFLPDGWVLNNRDLALEAVKQNGEVLAYLPQKFKEDKEICLEAVKKNGTSYFDISDKLLDDKEIMLEAMKTEVDSLILHELKIIDYSKADALELVQTNGWSLDFLPPEFTCDKEIVTAAVKQNGTSFFYADLKLKRDRKYVLELLEINSVVFDYVSYTLRSDPNFIEEAKSISEEVSKFISEAVDQFERMFVGESVTSADESTG